MNMSWQEILRYVGAVVVGLVLGGMVNFGIILVGGELLPPPAGVDATSMESLAASMHLYQPYHFLPPFLAHALGTLLGAVLAALIAGAHQLRFGFGIGCCFLFGGAQMVLLLPAPLWFEALDLVVAYIPMGWLGARIALRLGSAAR